MLVKAPAKINLCLKVLRPRPDGYHDIYSIMQKVSLYDSIHLRVRGKKIVVETDNHAVPSGRENLAYKAAELFLSFTGIKSGIEIFINKKIPSGAGLGGGSSDAGAVLKALNFIFGTGMNTEELIGLAQQIGSDVPFFVYPSTSAIVEGRGELLRPVSIPEKWYLLVNPGVHIATGWAYNELDKVKNILTKQHNRVRILKLNKRSFFKGLSNDLEKVSMEKYPVLNDIKSHLKRAGAITSVMSGSGSTIAGIFDSENDAKIAYNMIPVKYWKRIVKGL